MPALKKPAKSKPSAPKKPSSKSKTGNSACSQAASNWQLSIRGKEALNPDTYATLAKCRAMTSTKKKAMLNEASGKLSAQGRQAIESRLQSRFDRGLVTQKSRTEKLKELLAARKAKQTAVVKPAETTDKTRALVERVRQSETYGATRTFGRNAQNDVKEGLRYVKDYASTYDESKFAPKFRRGKVRRTLEQADYYKSQGQIVDGDYSPSSFVAKSTEARQLNRLFFPNGDKLKQRTRKEEPKRVWVDTGNPKESSQVKAMQGKLERMKGQFDSKFDDLVDQRRGGGGTPFITDTAKGRAEIHQSQKANESLSNLNKSIKQQEEKIQDAQFRYNMRHTQTKKSAEFIGRNEISPGLKYLQKTGAVKQWDRNPEFFFVPGLPKTALITVKGQVGVASRFAPKSPEHFNAAKRIAGQANSIVKTANVVSNVRAKSGYAEARLMATQNKGRVSQGKQPTSAPAGLTPPPAQAAPPAQPPAIDKTRSLVERVRKSEKYGITRTYGRAVQSDVSKALVTARNANEMVNAKADTGRMPTAKNLANTVARTERRSRVAEKKGQVVSGFQNFPDSAVYNSTLARQMKRSWFPNVTITPAAQKPAPPAFSRQGQLAQGRGTERRKELAAALRAMRQGSYEQIGRMAKREAGMSGLAVSNDLTQFRSRFDNGVVIQESARDFRRGLNELITQKDTLDRQNNLRRQMAAAAQKPAPAAPAFSRNGQLAPGRGTEYRKFLASRILQARKDVASKRGKNRENAKKALDVRRQTAYADTWYNNNPNRISNPQNYKYF